MGLPIYSCYIPTSPVEERAGAGASHHQMRHIIKPTPDIEIYYTQLCCLNSFWVKYKTFLINFIGRTRTKDKYRVVYSDHQRLELEKEFHYSRYITIRRKAELANNVGLSERQVRKKAFITEETLDKVFSL